MSMSYYNNITFSLKETEAVAKTSNPTDITVLLTEECVCSLVTVLLDDSDGLGDIFGRMLHISAQNSCITTDTSNAINQTIIRS